MTNIIGEAIFQHRKRAGMTQDQFGAKFRVTGPAIFKFEKGFVRPSLEVWLKIAEDMDIARSHAVMMWMKDRLPEEFTRLIDLKETTIESDGPGKSKVKYQSVDYGKMGTPEEVRQRASSDKTLPRGLVALMKDKKLWETVKPEGDEVAFLRDAYQTVGSGTKYLFVDALEVLRKFKQARR